MLVFLIFWDLEMRCYKKKETALLDPLVVISVTGYLFCRMIVELSL